MRIVCWQTILLKYHTFFFSKFGKDVLKLSPAAVVIGAVRIKNIFIISYMVTQCNKLKYYFLVVLHENQNKSDPGNTILQ